MRRHPVAASSSVNLQTGIPILRALSARLAEIPEPGSTTTPIDKASSI